MVEHGGTCSTKRNLIYGVPQGSVLGPISFLLYTDEINDILERYGLHSQCYADDCHVHSSSKPVEKEILQRTTIECIDGISSWMASNRLKLNPEKNGIHLDSILGAQASVEPFTNYWQRAVDNPVFNNSPLGAHVDETMCFEIHESKMVSACFFQIEITQMNS